ncbi:MAG: RtcB family protein [Janthinobacterium lividum]
MLTGQDIIALGLRPGKYFKEILTHANAHGLEGEALAAYVAPFRSPAPLPLRPVPLPFQENIRASSAVEAHNVEQVRASMRELMRVPTVVAGAVMPDACPAGPLGTIPVGGVVAARNAIHPGMHSADICCSVMLTNLGRQDPRAVLDAAQAITHFGPGGRAPERQFALPESLRAELAANSYLNSMRGLQLAQEHLGTQGDGNHFLYVGTQASTGDTVLVTHHGSRGVGALLYKAGMHVAERFRQELSPATAPANAWIPADTPEGAQYWAALQLVRRWTKLNHEVLHDALAARLGVAAPQERFWNEHNFVFRDGDTYYHAKGATPLAAHFLPDAPDARRIIPLNMAQPILIVEGDVTAGNLGFAPHGAGRNLSRTQHKRQLGSVTDEAQYALETQGIDARFFFNRIDTSELPSAYKNAAEVRQQIAEFNLARVVDEIHPYGCLMAGDWEHDAPWKAKRRAKLAAREPGGEEQFATT